MPKDTDHVPRIVVSIHKNMSLFILTSALCLCSSKSKSLLTIGNIFLLDTEIYT